MSPELEFQIHTRRTQGGESFASIARTLDIPRTTVRDAFYRYESNSVEKPTESKVLIFDIETAPTLAYLWGRYNQNVNTESQVEAESYMLTWAAKWLGDDLVMTDSAHLHTDQPEDDRAIVESLSTLIDQADLLVAHNGDKFDIPIVKTRMLHAGHSPLRPIKSVDTLKIAKKTFRFPSNKLDTIAKYLGYGTKIETNFALWTGCLSWDVESFNKMIDYNAKDVELLEKVYLRLAPWYSSHPNIANIVGEHDCMRCPVCGSGDLEEDRFAYTGISKFQAYQCNNCGAWARGRVNIKSKEEMANTITPVK